MLPRWTKPPHEHNTGINLNTHPRTVPKYPGCYITLIAEKQPFTGVENYFMDFLLYQDSLEVSEEPPLRDTVSGNEADI